MESDRSESAVGTEKGLRDPAARLRSDLALSHQENRELQERLMVSEATVHAQAEQLKDYRDLLSEYPSGTCGLKLESNNKTFISLCSRNFSPAGQ